MTSNLARRESASDSAVPRPAAALYAVHPLSDAAPLVVEFTSARARQRPLAARAGGVEVNGARLPVRAVDTERYPELRRRFNINLLPTFVVIDGEREVARFVGPHSRRELAAAIRRALDPRLIAITEAPRPRAIWNEFSTRLWGLDG